MTTEQLKTGRREARKQDRRDAIIAAARYSFLENGYAGTSMSAISSELGGSKGTLWSYFPSKADLFIAVVDQLTTAYRREFADTLQPAGNLGDTIFQFCWRFIEKLSLDETIALHRLVISEAARFPEVGEIFYRRAPQATRELLAPFLAAQMDANRLRRDDPSRAAQLLLTLCLGGPHQRMACVQATPKTDEIRREAEYVADIFMRIYKPDQ